jgi:hypothetical protein
MPSWLTVLFCFQIGWIPIGNAEFYDNTITDANSIPMFGAFEIEAIAFDHIVIGGRWDSYFSLVGIGSFFPTGITYAVNIGLRFGDDNTTISIKCEHLCSHPIAPHHTWTKGEYTLDSGFERVYVEVRGKI